MNPHDARRGHAACTHAHDLFVVGVRRDLGTIEEAIHGRGGRDHVEPRAVFAAPRTPIPNEARLANPSKHGASPHERPPRATATKEKHRHVL